MLSNPSFDSEGRGNFDTLQAYNRLAFGWDKPLGPHLTMLTRASIGVDRNDLGAGGGHLRALHELPHSLRHGTRSSCPSRSSR